MLKLVRKSETRMLSSSTLGVQSHKYLTPKLLQPLVGYTIKRLSIYVARRSVNHNERAQKKSRHFFFKQYWKQTSIIQY